MKKINIGEIKTIYKNGNITGIATTREVSYCDCKYIFNNIFGIAYIPEIDGYQEKVSYLINNWLNGSVKDNEISDFIQYYTGESLKAFSLLNVLSYLKFRKYL